MHVALWFLLSVVAPGYSENLEVGLTFADLGQCDRAIAFLEKARAADPKAPAASLALGSCYSKTGRADDAVWMLRAFTSSPRGGEAWFYLGEAYRVLGRNDEARDAYRRAAELRGPLGDRALLEAGNLSLALGDFDTAEKDFEQVLKSKATDETADAARKGLSRTASQRRVRAGFMADFGFRYDSNVILQHEALAAKAGGIRAVLNLFGRYRVIDSTHWRSELAAAVNQGRYLKPALHPYDLGAQRLNAEVLYKVQEFPLRIGLEGDALYNTLDLKYYNLGFGVGPRASVAEGGHLATTLSWHVRSDNFRDTRNASNRRTQLGQSVLWGSSGYAGLNLTHEQNQAEAADYTYVVKGVRLSGGDGVWRQVLVDAALDYAVTDFSARSGRVDKTVAASLGVARYWGAWGGRLSGAWVHNRTVNGPAGAGLDYAKTLTGLDLRYRF